MKTVHINQEIAGGSSSHINPKKGEKFFLENGLRAIDRADKLIYPTI